MDAPSKKTLAPVSWCAPKGKTHKMGGVFSGEIPLPGCDFPCPIDKKSTQDGPPWYQYADTPCVPPTESNGANHVSSVPETESERPFPLRHRWQPETWHFVACSPGQMGCAVTGSARHRRWTPTIHRGGTQQGVLALAALEAARRNGELDAWRRDHALPERALPEPIGKAT